jgi:hypothetical protein
MTSSTYSDYLEVLEKRMLEISNLSVADKDKKDLVKNLFSRYTAELDSELTKVETKDDAVKVFNHYINNILSILETLVSKEIFKSMRRLILNEIHGAKDQIIIALEKHGNHG